MTVIINFVGGPGSGKTAFCCHLFAEMKMRGMCVEYVPEIAKTLVWTKQFDLLNNQHYVTMKQYELLKAVDNKVDYIVTDGPLLHGLFYNFYNKDNYCNPEKVNDMILEKISEFNNMYIHITKGEFIYEPVGRLENEKESKIIGKELSNIMDGLRFTYDKLVSGRNGIDKLLSILDRLEEEKERVPQVISNDFVKKGNEFF